MNTELLWNSYGRGGIRLLKVVRSPERDAVADLTVSVGCEGDYGDAYLRGCNACILPTDTMRNAVHALAHLHLQDSVEAFGLRVAEHFLDAAPCVERVTVELTERPWSVVGAEHGRGHSFVRAGNEERVTCISATPGAVEVEAGLTGLELLKTQGSTFEGFYRDDYTTTAEAADRLLCTSLSARWRYWQGPVPFADCWRRAREALVGAFSAHHSPSLQHTLYVLANAVLLHCPEIEEIHLTLPNLHHVLVDLAPFGLANPNVTYEPRSGAHGVIEARVRRAAAPAQRRQRLALVIDAPPQLTV